MATGNCPFSTATRLLQSKYWAVKHLPSSSAVELRILSWRGRRSGSRIGSPSEAGPASLRCTATSAIACGALHFLLLWQSGLMFRRHFVPSSGLLHSTYLASRTTPSVIVRIPSATTYCLPACCLPACLPACLVSLLACLPACSLPQPGAAPEPTERVSRKPHSARPPVGSDKPGGNPQVHLSFCSTVQRARLPLLTPLHTEIR